MPRIAPRLLMFLPEEWGEVTRFAKFQAKTYNLEGRGLRALDGVGYHMTKAARFRRLAERLKPNLLLERQALDEAGYSDGEASQELATVLEAGIVELYSSVDCSVKVVHAVFAKGSRGLPSSTRKTFQNVDRVEGTFPDDLKRIISEAVWHAPLMYLRDDLVHLDTGSVFLEEDTGTVRYDHHGKSREGGRFTIPDVFAWFDEQYDLVNGFHGAVFRYLNDTLRDEPVFQVCGMVDGRVLHRYVRPIGSLTFDSGSCGAWVWFEKPEFPDCPFKDHCGAYRDKAEPEGWETD